MAGRELGRDQLLAFYISAGVLASLASHLATVRCFRTGVYIRVDSCVNSCGPSFTQMLLLRNVPPAMLPHTQPNFWHAMTTNRGQNV